MRLSHGSYFEFAAGLYLPTVDGLEAGGTCRLASRWVEPVLPSRKAGSIYSAGYDPLGHRRSLEADQTQTCQYGLSLPQMRGGNQQETSAIRDA